MALIGGLALFLFSLALHVVVWRLWRPHSYRVWLPALTVIFGPVAAATVWIVGLSPMDAVALLMLHGSLACVYIIGYTLVSAFSPSVELLKFVDRSPAGIPPSMLRLPLLASALTGDRLETLARAGLVRQMGGRLDLGPRGKWLTGLVLNYRHAIGLQDHEGG